MSSCDIPVISENPSFDDDDTKFFLQCVKNHPNLTDSNHKFFNDAIMQKATWGLIAKDNGISPKEAVEKWQLLIDKYMEEENCLSALSSSSNTNENDNRVSFPHYNFMKELMSSSSKSKLSPTENLKVTSAKRKSDSDPLLSGIKRAKQVNQQIKKKLEQLTQIPKNDATLDPSLLAGRIVFKELQKRSPQSSQTIRSRLLQLAAQLNPNDD